MRSRSNKKKKYTILLIFINMLSVIAMITAGILAKYRTIVEVDEKIQFSADLAERITLTEHAIERNSDGSYSLTADIKADGKNTYVVMPGVDIPKDPTFTITNKSSIPAYLYVEVVESMYFPDTVTYKLTEEWKDLEVTGKNGGKVYVYKNALNASSPTSIQILKDNELIISQNYHDTGFELDFFGYMAQDIEGKSELEIFNMCFNAS